MTTEGGLIGGFSSRLRAGSGLLAAWTVIGDPNVAELLIREGFDTAVLDMQQHAPAPDLRKLRRDVPRALSDTVMKALSKARDARWQTAADMRHALLPYAVVS